MHRVAERVEDRRDVPSIGSRCTQALPAGRTTYSANAPSSWTPRARVWMHRWRRPARQLRQRPQTTWPSPLTWSPTSTSVTPEPTSTTSPANSWPTVRGQRDRPRRPGVPGLDVQIGAADAGGRTSTSTSPGPTGGVGISTSSSPGPGAVLTSALTAPLRAPGANGEAPAKYELAGASVSLLRAEALRADKHLYMPAGAAARAVDCFFQTSACHLNVTACHDDGSVSLGLIRSEGRHLQCRPPCRV